MKEGGFEKNFLLMSNIVLKIIYPGTLPKVFFANRSAKKIKHSLYPG